MSRSVIYTVSNGQLTAMRPAAPENEDTMQRLVAEHPEIITDNDGELLLVQREQRIGDGEGDGRWSLDHLFVTRDGVPVLVELKRATDTRLRREVVGQMLDYAANATAYWKAGTIAASFELTMRGAGRDPVEVLSEFLGDEADPDAFWQRVDDSFASGRIKLVFVADIIPRELARIVEFLNEQMKADVRAVELNWFEAQGVRAFTPRVIGETQRAQAAKAGARSYPPAISQDDWIQTNLVRFGPDVVRAAKTFIKTVMQAGGHAEVAKAQGSLIAVFEHPTGSSYPMSLTRYGKIKLSLGYLKARPPFDQEDVRRKLHEQLTALVGPLSSSTSTGFPSFAAIELNDEHVRDGISAMLRSIASRVGSE